MFSRRYRSGRLVQNALSHTEGCFYRNMEVKISKTPLVTFSSSMDFILLFISTELNSDAHLPKKFFNCFFISCKRSFCSWDIFMSWLFGYVEKRFDQKVKVNIKIRDVIDWTSLKYSRNKRNQRMKFGQSIEDKMRNIFLRNHKQNVVEKLV